MIEIIDFSLTSVCCVPTCVFNVYFRVLYKRCFFFDGPDPHSPSLISDPSPPSGEYHCLEQEYEFQVFSLIAQFVEENSWTLETVQRDLTVTTLSELEPRPVVEACFDRYLQPSGVARADTGQTPAPLLSDS